MIFTSAYKIPGTKTGRLASSKFLGEFGANGQNQSDELRRLFIPRFGYRFIQNDLEGAEAVAVALLCGEGNFRDLVRRKVKIHNFVCLKIFPSKFEQWFTAGQIDALTPQSFHEHPHYKDIIKHCKFLHTEYDLAKRTVHGSNYSMRWKTFQENVLKETEGAVVLSAQECKRLLNAYFTIFPEIKVFQAEADKAAQEFLPMQNLFGWEIKVIQRYTTSLGRTCLSWRPQSTVGIAGILGGVRLQHYIEEAGRRWNVLTITHDSNLSEAPAAEAEECAIISAECLSFELTSPIDNWKCRIGVEKSIGDNWGKYDEAENPRGLKVIA